MILIFVYISIGLLMRFRNKFTCYTYNTFRINHVIKIADDCGVFLLVFYTLKD